MPELDPIQRRWVWTRSQSVRCGGLLSTQREAHDKKGVFGSGLFVDIQGVGGNAYVFSSIIGQALRSNICRYSHVPPFHRDVDVIAITRSD